ncbi:MAG: pyridoxal-phosphate dependent enzyme, partial [FCB group bacterium]|nr:pyridoxal-phosphate dependent enzyme [FCB group bacterium]
MTTTETILQQTIQRCREQKLILPTYSQMRNPETVPETIQKELSQIGLWDVNPRNLFRITWKNEPVDFGGGFGPVNVLEMPSELTGVPARIFVLLGKYFPTGAHKVGATFGPLVERLITGRFDPTTQKALWPSTGNYCRGGVYDSALLGCESIAVLPEEMSRERFDWLKNMGAEVIATPGSESNVKEIYDRVKLLLSERGNQVVSLNQFEDFGNPRWHYAVTGPAMEEVYEQHKGSGDQFAGVFLTQGSGGTLGSAEYLRRKFPALKVGAGEALQCPTLLYNGYGAHRIEGIGDKHVPWIMNLKNIDAVAGIDDQRVYKLMRLFNESAGQTVLADRGLDRDFLHDLNLLGISGIANLLGAIHMARYFELTSRDFLFTVATDSMDMYQSRL